MTLAIVLSGGLIEKCSSVVVESDLLMLCATCPRQLLKLKSAYEELEEALEASKRENRHLQGERWRVRVCACKCALQHLMALLLWHVYAVGADCTLHPVPCTLHPVPCTLHLVRHLCAGEVQDLSKQLDQGGLSTHELEKVKRRLEAEIDELTQQLQVCAGHGSSLEIIMSHKPPDVCAWCWLHRLQVVLC